MTCERVLIIEDDEFISLALRTRLEEDGYQVQEARDGKEGMRAFNEDDWDAVLLDHMLPDTEGLPILEEMRRQDADPPIIYMTAYSTVALAVNSMKAGAYDYLTKPLDLDEVVLVLKKALEVTALKREVRRIRKQQMENFGFDKIIGNSPKIQRVLQVGKTVAESEASSILITGESGTGKNLVAQAIHYNSRRAHKPFITINCTALPEHLLESELFGHEKGAFTDARERKRGLFEVGDGGTIFLDEIGDLPMSLQAKLLGFLEGRAIRRVGGIRDIPIDARIVAATNQNLKESIDNKLFRSDLYYRINVIHLEMPPLRTRRDDIPILAKHFINHFNQRFNKNVQGVEDEVIRWMDSYEWEGNVREFRNLFERAMILGRGDRLKLADFFTEIGAAPFDDDAGRYILPGEGIDLEEVEKDFLRQALNQADGNQSKAARLLGLSRDQLRYRVKSYGLDREVGRPV